MQSSSLQCSAVSWDLSSGGIRIGNLRVGIPSRVVPRVVPTLPVSFSNLAVIIYHCRLPLRCRQVGGHARA